jgi:hypothetical protein
MCPDVGPYTFSCTFGAGAGVSIIPDQFILNIQSSVKAELNAIKGNDYYNPLNRYMLLSCGVGGVIDYI